MYEPHPVFEPPSESAILWRYISFAKFASLLARQALYFVRVDHLQDTYEGRLPKPTFDVMDPHLRAAYEDMRVSSIINCWTLSDHESLALWKTYVPQGEGVALRSSFTRLRDAFRAQGLFQDAHLLIGKVRYVDFREHDFVGSDRLAFNGFVPLVHKRQYFAFEQEVRLVISGLGTSFLDSVIRQTPGFYVPVAVRTLLERVHVAPNAPQWFRETVSATCSSYGFPDIQVVQSSMDEPPPL